MAADEESKAEVMVVDATGQIAGRLSSSVAKVLLKGSRVVIVNAEKTLLSGNRRSIMDEWNERLEIASITHPKHGPFHPREPGRILSRMIRGMVPRRQPKGRFAFKRLRVYEGVPVQYSKLKLKTFEEAKITKPRGFYVPIGDVAAEIGWKGFEE